MELQRRIGFPAAFATIVFLAATLTGCGSGSSPASAPAVASSSNDTFGTNTPTPSTSPPPVPGPAHVGSAVISWLAPTTNTDGTALTNLAGFYIRYGTEKASLDHRIAINTVGISNYVVDNLASGTYYFSVSSYTTTGVESDPSKVVSKTI